MQVQPLHAPGRITWPLDGTDTSWPSTTGCNPMPGSAPGPGQRRRLHRRAGVAGTAPQKIFERLVDPFANPAERRTLQSHVALPPHLPGSRLVLRTDPGPHGNNAWDWSYVTHVLLKSA